MSHTKQHVGILYIVLAVSYGMLGPGARSLDGTISKSLVTIIPQVTISK